MLYIRTGGDTKMRQKADKFFSGTTRILRGDEVESIKLYLQPDMFGNVEVLRIEDWQNEKDREMLYKYLKDIQLSKNVFLIDEISILAATFKKLSSFAEKVFDCNEAATLSRKVDPFVLANFIQKKNKKSAWIELQNIKDKISAEELQGVLFWKMKTIGDRSGMFSLIDMRHNAHEGESNLYDDLEKLILKL